MVESAKVIHRPALNPDVIPKKTDKTSKSVDISSRLSEVYRDIDRVSYLNNYHRGWRVIEERNGVFASTIYESTAVAGTLSATAFSITSIMFGILAGIQGIEEYIEGVNPFVGGHFSEWTLQGIYSFSLCLKAHGNVSSLGRQVNARQIFLNALQDQTLSETDLQKLYQEYLDYFDSQPMGSTVHIPQLPILPTDFRSKLPEVMNADYLLRDTYRSIERRLSRRTFVKNVFKGWVITQAKIGHCKAIAFQIAVVGVLLFSFIHLVNYSLSIFWAGKQSYDDYNNGDNPNVGGHSLEWSFEAFAIVSLIWHYVGELANVGKTQQILDIFEGEISQLVQNDSIENKDILTQRLRMHMRNRIRKLPQGKLFSIPLRLMFDETKPKAELP